MATRDAGSPIKVVLTDIEGTTSSLSFVKDVLFPYARKHLAAFVHAHGEQAEVRTQLDAVSEAVSRPLTNEEAIAQLIRWIDEDRKITPLKALQGMIWERGYREGDYEGHMYDDAVAALRRWHADGVKLYVFSSGSVKAQKLLFAHTAHGDLTPLFSGYFDTTTGPKREPGAYQSIARAIGLPPREMIFLSDIEEELDAAREAGMRTTKLVRPGASSSPSRHKVVTTFDDIAL